MTGTIVPFPMTLARWNRNIGRYTRPPQFNNVVPLPSFPLDPWGRLPPGKSLYQALRDEACQMHPQCFDSAFRQLCSRACYIVHSRRWATWSTDFRRAQDREDLLLLADVDVDAFLASSDARGMIDMPLVTPTLPESLVYQIPPQPGLVA
jgi:hypothetical protein